MKARIAVSFLLVFGLSCGDNGTTGEDAAHGMVRNVIVMQADDLGYSDVSSYVTNPRIPTPHIDSIGTEGVRFTDAYVTASVCSPSRAALLTGRYQQRFGFEFNAGGAARADLEGLGLDVAERTIADFMRSTGRRTALIGKWHQGTQDQFLPTTRGFDEFFGFLTGQTAYLDPDAPGHVGADLGGSRSLLPRSVYGPHNQIQRGDRTVVDNAREYLTEEITREAVAFIDRNASEPFYLHVAFHAPHVPLQTTQKYYDRFPNIESQAQRVYAAMVSAMDDGVGAILDRLERHGLSEDTLVIFLSDNGCAVFTGACSCDPLRGGKLTGFEGGVRVPFLVKWPGGLPRGQVYGEIVSALDILPTVAAAVGTPLPDDRAYDGVDLLPYLTGATGGAPHSAVFWRTGSLVGAREGDWKLWESRDGGFSLLFDLATDIGEQDDRVERDPERRDLLRQSIVQWERDLGEPSWAPREVVGIACDGFVEPVPY